RSKVLNIPFCFPPDSLKHGTMLSALGVPDLRGTTSTYFSLSDSFSKEQLTENLGGGKRVALSFDGADEAFIHIPGPRDLRRKFNETGAYTKAPLTIKVNRSDHRGIVAVDGKRVELEQGVWSEWLEMSFVMSDTVTVRGITRFFPQEIGEQTRIYMACVQYHPAAPYAPLSVPESYSAELKDRYGIYKTIGWAYDTHALRQNDIDEDAFLKDIEQTMAWRERLTLDELERGEFDMLLSAWTATDRAGHMFWHFRDEKHPYYVPDAPVRWRKALEYTYKRADEITGKVLEKLNDEDLLFVFSDHGFGSWRMGFNLNTWLRDNGYLSVANPEQAERGFLQGINWNETRAYAMGLSSFYLNLQGRETGGIVEPGKAESLA
ncbi:MAG: alkaline phosphatase family protein, partial [Candidatus Hydrogenedentes bacterium]|nr:alkaline phosphatase family protein [Candidatus Hydrogenedentota bacterium]